MSSWDDFWGGALEFLVMKVFLPLCVVFCIALPFGIGYWVWFDSTHSCSKWTAPYYHPPTYVMAGKVMIPSGGGTYSDCVEYRSK